METVLSFVGELYLERRTRGRGMAFDFHPILDAGDNPRPNQWYVVSPEGSGSCSAPCQRVGACANFVTDDSERGGGGRVLISAGAAPEGLCSDIHELLITKGPD